MLNNEEYEYFLQIRCVETPCPKCGGSGVRTYGDTSTWRRGGIAGQSLTPDVCDECWGSGDKYRKGADLRKLFFELNELRNEVNQLRALATEGEKSCSDGS